MIVLIALFVLSLARLAFVVYQAIRRAVRRAVMRRTIRGYNDLRRAWERDPGRNPAPEIPALLGGPRAVSAYLPAPTDSESRAA